MPRGSIERSSLRSVSFHPPQPKYTSPCDIPKAAIFQAKNPPSNSAFWIPHVSSAGQLVHELPDVSWASLCRRTQRRAWHGGGTWE